MVVLLLLVLSGVMVAVFIWPRSTLGSIYHDYVLSIHAGRERIQRFPERSIQDVLNAGRSSRSTIFDLDEEPFDTLFAGPVAHYEAAGEFIRAIRSGRFDIAMHILSIRDVSKHEFVLFDLLLRSLGARYEASYVLKHLEDPDRLTGLTHLRSAELLNCGVRSTAGRSTICSFGAYRFSQTEELHLALQYWQKTLQHEPDPTTRWLHALTRSLAGLEMGQDAWSVQGFRSASEDTVVRFQNMAQEFGLDDVSFYGGVCVDDFTGDGRVDVVSSSGDLRTPMVFKEQCADGTFRDVSAAYGISEMVGGAHLEQVDFDRDGWFDLYVIRGGWLVEEAHFHPNSLLRNDEGNGFQDVTIDMGLYHPHRNAHGSLVRRRWRWMDGSLRGQ